MDKEKKDKSQAWSLSFRSFGRVLKRLDSMCVEGSIILIRWYQKYVSPDHSFIGNACPVKGCAFYPSCSEYGVLVLRKYGFLKGCFYILKRILRCHPWTRGGVDLP